MNKRIKQGNDVTVRFSAFTDGNTPAVLPPDTRVRVWRNDNPADRFTPAAVAVEGNVVSFVVRGDKQTVPGPYRAVVTYLDPDARQCAVDALLFEIVKFSSQQGGHDQYPAVATEHIAVEASADTGKPGKSAYLYAVEGGYAGSEEEFYAVLGTLAPQPAYYDLILAASAWNADNEQTLALPAAWTGGEIGFGLPVPTPRANAAAVADAQLAVAAVDAGSITFSCLQRPAADLTVTIAF